MLNLGRQTTFFILAFMALLMLFIFFGDRRLPYDFSSRTSPSFNTEAESHDHSHEHTHDDHGHSHEMIKIPDDDEDEFPPIDYSGKGTEWAVEFLNQQAARVSKKVIKQTCDFKNLKYPARVQEIVGGTGQRYKIFLHPPGQDIHISDLHWNSGIPGQRAFESNYHQDWVRTLERIRKITKKNEALIVDIGANVGTHSMFFALQKAQVHAFEPSQSNFKLLQCAAYANKLTNIVLNDVALSEETSSGGGWCISTPETENQGHKVLTKDCSKQFTTDDGKENSEGIRTIPLDDYWKKVLHRERIDFIKIDIEGHEPMAFAGAQELLKNAPPYAIYSEFQPIASAEFGKDPVKFLESMWAFGYNCEIFGSTFGFSRRAINDVAAAKELVEYIRNMNKTRGIYLMDLVFHHRDLVQSDF